MNIDHGFTLEDALTRNVLWGKPFDSLRSSADDGKRIVWLSFHGDEDKVGS